MRHKREIVIIIEAVLAVCFVVLLLVMLLGGRSTRQKRIALIMSDTTEDHWTSFLAGARAAAKEGNVRLVTSNADTAATLDDAMQMITEEIGDGADGLIVVPGCQDGYAEALKKTAGSTPLLLAGCDLQLQDGTTPWSVVEPDQENIGEKVGKAILEDFSGSLSGKTIGIAVGNGMAADQRIKGLKEVLQGSGAEIVWTHRGTMQTDDEKLSFEKEEAVDLVAALDLINLENAGSLSEAQNLHGAIIYGVGSSEKSIYYLDHGQARALVVPNDYMTGYKAVSAMAKKLKHPFSTLTDERVSATCYRQSDIFTESSEAKLFPADG